MGKLKGEEGIECLVQVLSKPKNDTAQLAFKKKMMRLGNLESGIHEILTQGFVEDRGLDKLSQNTAIT